MIWKRKRRRVHASCVYLVTTGGMQTKNWLVANRLVRQEEAVVRTTYNAHIIIHQTSISNSNLIIILVLFHQIEY